MFHSALSLCILAQAFLPGLGNEPSSFSLNDILSDGNSVSDHVDNINSHVDNAKAHLSNALDKGKEHLKNFDLGGLLAKGKSHAGSAANTLGNLLSSMGNSGNENSNNAASSELGTSALGKILGSESISNSNTASGIVTDTRRRRSSPSFAREMENTDWDIASKNIIDGMMKEFFAKVSLQQTEKDCLDQKLGAFTGDLAGIVQSAVKSLKPIFSSTDSDSSPQLSSFAPLLLTGVSSITDMVTTGTVIAKDCLQADGLALMKQTGQKLLNFSFIEHQLLVNGVDIANALAEGVIAFEDERYTKFGEEIGISLRKVLLSTNNNMIQLPEGMATEHDISEASKGIAQGFFADGSTLTITDRANSDVNLKIDLHLCIVDNHDFFKDVFKGIWELIAQLAANAAQHQFNMGNISNILGLSGNPKWIGELTLAFARVPILLERCNVMNSDSQEMLMDSIKTLGAVRLKTYFPDDSTNTEDATKKVAYAVERFSRKDYYGFGKELGKLFREFLLLAFPQDYTVDEFGHLKRKLTGLARLNSFGGQALMVGGVAFLLLFSTIAVKRLRVASKGQTTGKTLIDVGDSEDDDIEMLE